MRNLNLSRLARASESSFFKKEQAQQAIDIRSKLTDVERTALQTKSLPSSSSSSSSTPVLAHSPDVLPEISAHSVYSRAIQNARSDLTVQPQRMTPRPLIPPVTAITTTGNKPEPQMLRALGTGKLSIYSQQQQQTVQSRPLPGGSQYADGAVVGIASFSIASAIVASVGLGGVIILWSRPEIIEGWKQRTIQLRHRLDGQLGTFFRNQVSSRMTSEPAISDETRLKASALARGAVGLPIERTIGNSSSETISTTRGRK